MKQVIEDFKIDDWKQLDASEVEKYIEKIDNYFKSELGFTLFTAQINNSNNLPSKVYRMRKHDGHINSGLISEYSHPPVNLAKSIQRANLPYHPVFYCAPVARTALIETLEYTFREGEDNLYYLSQWCVKKNHPINLTAFIYGDFDKSGDIDKLSEKPMADFNPDETESMKLILKFTSKLFEHADSHALSGYLGHTHLYASHTMRTDVLVYPSIQTNKLDLNFAIHPNAVLHMLFLNKVFLIRPFEYKFDKVSTRIYMKYSLENQFAVNNEHGYLTWKSLPEEERQYCYSLLNEKNS